MADNIFIKFKIKRNEEGLFLEPLPSDNVLFNAKRIKQLKKNERGKLL